MRWIVFGLVTGVISGLAAVAFIALLEYASHLTFNELAGVTIPHPPGDKLIDFPADKGCASASDPTETAGTTPDAGPAADAAVVVDGTTPDSPGPAPGLEVPPPGDAPAPQVDQSAGADSGATVDASGEPPTAAGDEGCGCAAGPSGGGAASAALALLLLLVAARRRR